MNISVQKILEKMTVELNHAKISSDDNQLRDKLIAIRTLCDIVLDDSSEKVKTIPAPVITSLASVPGHSIPDYRVQTNEKQERLQEDDGNGDSLFDF